MIASDIDSHTHYGRGNVKIDGRYFHERKKQPIGLLFREVGVDGFVPPTLCL